MSSFAKRAFTAWKSFARDVEITPWKRNTARASFIVLYAACGIAGYRYLQDTKYRALGEPSPYKPIHPQPASKVVEAHDTTPVYDGLAADYDSRIWVEELTSYIWWMRRRLGKQIRGDALEVACGTGRNIRWLRPGQVRSLTLVDSSRPMLEVAREKYEAAKSLKDAVPAQFVQGRAEDLGGLAARSGQQFDTVYESFGLCSHEDPDAALQNMAALLRPGGRIVLLEHGRGYFESMNHRMDDRAEERSKEWGCRWNLDIDAIVRKSGLQICQEAKYHFGTIQFYVLEKQLPPQPPQSVP